MQNIKMKKVIKILFNILASKELFAWLIILWVVYYIAAAIYIREALAIFIVELGSNPVFIFLHLLFLTVFFLRIMLDMRSHLSKGILFTAGKAFLPVGIFLIILYILIHSITNIREKVLAAEGDMLFPRGMTAPLKLDTVSLNIKSPIIAGIHNGQKTIFEREPTVLFEVRGKKKKMGAYPPAYIKGRFFQLLDFGIAPQITIKRDGEKIIEAPVALKLFPPGREDFFEIPGLPYRFYVKLHPVQKEKTPDETIQKEKTRERFYDLSSPVYFVTIFKGDVLIHQGETLKGVSFKNYNLSFSGYIPWVHFVIVNDPGMPILAIGLLMVVIGIPWRMSLFIKEKFL
jgi:hypothetical protein